MRNSSYNAGIIKLLQLEAYADIKISFVVVSWGSSVLKAIGSGLDRCFTLTQQKEYQVQHRHLRDYKKLEAKLTAGFTSALQ